jgi:small subunit ribosomal protein S16
VSGLFFEQKRTLILDFSRKFSAMVTIRLARGGAKKRPFYHIVVTDSRARRDSSYIERLGYFNPSAKGQDVRLNLENERIAHWLGEGAQPSERVAKLLKEEAKAA